jgi:hypothetical protein
MDDVTAPTERMMLSVLQERPPLSELGSTKPEERSSKPDPNDTQSRASVVAVKLARIMVIRLAEE